MIVGQAGQYVVSKPFPANHYGRVWEWLKQHEKQTMDSASPQTKDATFQEGKAETDMGTLSYAVHEGEKEPQGCVWFQFAGLGVYFGHLAFDSIPPKVKAETTRVALQDAFHSGARKVQWFFLADNVMFKNFLTRRIGAKPEGLMRKQTQRGTEWVDVLVMASFPKEFCQ